MERQRSHGATATPGRYLATTIAQFLTHTDRRSPALTVRRPGVAAVADVYFAFVQNTAPWTFLGPVRLDPRPRCLLRHRDRHVRGHLHGGAPSLRHVRRMVLRSGTASRSGLLALHDQAELVIEAERPLPLQVDGDSCGLVGAVRLRSVPGALRVFC